MVIRFNKNAASDFLREQAQLATEATADAGWVAKVEELSRLCEEGVAKTHIAFLGTALLAKALNQGVDLYAIKPSHAPDRANAFSARSLAHTVLVPLSAELGISLGVTGREPLNNQPYFRMTSLDDGTPVHAGGRAAFDYMLELITELQRVGDRGSAEVALRSYVVVRRRYQPRYVDQEGDVAIKPSELAYAIRALVSDSSEGGKRAQAVAAGLLDVLAGEEWVDSGRINDPDRRYPGDVCIRSASDGDSVEKAFEVRDKLVTAHDVQIFGRKCIERGVREAAVVMVSDKQEPLDPKVISSWADEHGIGVTLFHGWPQFVEQALFWGVLPKPVASSQAVKRIHERLIDVEASPAAVALWHELTRAG